MMQLKKPYLTTQPSTLLFWFCRNNNPAAIEASYMVTEMFKADGMEQFFSHRGDQLSRNMSKVGSSIS